MARQERRRFASDEGSLEYLSYVPDRKEDDDAPLPLTLFLHGAGERGRDLDLVRVHGLPREIDGGRAVPFAVVSPQCPPDTWWTSHSALLFGLLDEVAATLPIDRDRVYVTGISMGGYGTWKLLAEQPERFAAAIPICGGGDVRWADRIARVPVWTFHGDADETVPLSETERMVEALERLNAPVRITVYEGVGHDSWTQTYARDDVYEWLLAHRRRGGPPQ